MTDLSVFDGKRVYLSGPVSNVPDYNRAAFDRAARALHDAGAHVYNPTSITAAAVDQGWSHKACMARCLHELCECVQEVGRHPRPFYDAIALLPGWRDSEGARVEWTVAKAMGMQVFELGEGGCS